VPAGDRLIFVKPFEADTPQAVKMSSSGAGYQQLTREVSNQLLTLRGDLPGLMAGFGDLARTAMADGALSEKAKELIALALGIAGHCDACIGFHMKALVRLGATKKEVEETLAVAVYMGGGPSLMYSANALAAFTEFSASAKLQAPASA
jgi:AhpD family alkylhydroperoxidase